MTGGRLLICRTCPRYDVPRNGRFGRDLDSAIAADPAAAGVAVRRVACLGGCTEDGVVAVDGTGKARVRFTGLSGDDAGAIVRAALAYAGCDSGVPADWDVPAELADRIGAVTLKRAPRSDTGAAVPAEAGRTYGDLRTSLPEEAGTIMSETTDEPSCTCGPSCRCGCQEGKPCRCTKD